jgi:hypothetical protein
MAESLNRERREPQEARWSGGLVLGKPRSTDLSSFDDQVEFGDYFLRFLPAQVTLGHLSDLLSNNTIR